MRLLPVSLLCLSILPLLASAASPRAHFAKEIVLGAGETVGDLTMIAGKVTLNADSRAGQVRVDNGELNLKAGSAAESARMNNGDMTLAGNIAGDVFCGIGRLNIEAPAAIQGRILNLGCELKIGDGVTIGGDIVSFADQQVIGPDLTLPGTVYLLPGLDRRGKNRDQPSLEIQHDVQIAGGLKLGHCVRLERGNRVAVDLSGVAPHEPLNQARDRPAACKRLPGATGTFTPPDLTPLGPVYVFEGPELSEGQSLGNADLVFKGLEVPETASVGQIRIINGAVVLNEQAKAERLSVVNGAVVLKTGARVQGPVEIRNGPLVLEPGSSIAGPVTVYNSYIQVQKGAHIDGPTTFYGQELIVEDGGQLGDVRIGRLDDQAAEGKRDRASVLLDDGSALRGALVFDRPAVLKIRRGPTPAYSGVSPELKLPKAKRR